MDRSVDAATRRTPFGTTIGSTPYAFDANPATKPLTAVTALARCQTGRPTVQRDEKMICLFRHAARHISQVDRQDIGNAGEEACD